VAAFLLLLASKNQQKPGFCWFWQAKTNKNQFLKLVFAGFCLPKPTKTF
jgi:hypothetical protein